MINNNNTFTNLVNEAYISTNIIENVEHYKTSTEFRETLQFIKQYAPKAIRILDVGSGNGISVLSFALQGYHVTSIEPDISAITGAGAIKLLKEHYNIDTISIYETTAENANLDLASFDVVYCRQSLHHADNLNNFVLNTCKFLKKDGLFITVRDHVIYSNKDKQWFLKTHPLQQYYKGENAYTSKQYRNAFKFAGLKIMQELRFYDSILNYYPISEEKVTTQKALLFQLLSSKIGFIAKNNCLQKLYSRYSKIIDERQIPGRMYSYICIKLC